MKRAIFGLLLIVVLSLAGLIAMYWAPDADKNEIISKYSNEASQFFDTADGTRIHFRDEGVRSGPVLLLVHGNNASLHTWEPMVSELSDTFRLISFDLPGHGLTGPSAKRDYTATGFFESITAVFEHLDIEHATIVGNSMGGWLSWRYALAFEDRISSLILIDSNGAIVDEPVTPYAAGQFLDTKFGQFVGRRIAPRSLTRKSLNQVIWDDVLVTEALVNRYRDLALYPGNRGAMIERRSVDREPEYWDKISDIEQPVLILWGEHDKTIPPSHAHAFHDALGNSELIIYPDAAHNAMEELPVQVATDIRNWYVRAVRVTEPELSETEKDG